MIRPVVKYASLVWHYDILNYLSEEIETSQKRALKKMLFTLNYNKALDHMKILTLRQCRENLSDNSLKGNHNNLKFQENLPDKILTKYEIKSSGFYNRISYETECFNNSFFPQNVI